MESSYYARIRNEIARCIDERKQMVIFPMGQIGFEIKHIMEDAYGVAPDAVFDNVLSNYNPKIKPLDAITEMNSDNLVVFLANTSPNKQKKFLKMLRNYVGEDSIVKLVIERCSPIPETKIGKHSPTGFAHHIGIESIGAFCSIAPGVDVVPNHSTEYVSTHTMMYYGSEYDYPGRCYEDLVPYPSYIPGIVPKGRVRNKRSKIGNDVWLGRNVIICNGANIGNGVIAAAGAIITKDVPDYAIVGGVPARIIRYRFSPEEIEELNKIQWWNWEDEEIAERYDDFLLPIAEFIEKYKNK